MNANAENQGAKNWREQLVDIAKTVGAILAYISHLPN